MKKIRIAFTDFWDIFDPNENFIMDALRKNFDVEISEKDPEFVFCSIFGRRHLKYDCAKIFYTGENIDPDFNLVDYALGFPEIGYYDRYLRLPHYLLYPRACNLALSKPSLTDEQLLDYLSRIEQKTYDYLDSLTDEMLYECPENCEHTRMELVLRQFRHISFHTGMLNGQTAVATGQFPMWVSQADKYVDDGILFGRYRKGQVTK